MFAPSENGSSRNSGKVSPEALSQMQGMNGFEPCQVLLGICNERDGLLESAFMVLAEFKLKHIWSKTAAC